MRKALIIIDVQNDYFPNGRSELYESEKTAGKVKKLLDCFREHGEPIYFIRHVSPKGSDFFEEGTKGTEIYKWIAPLPSEQIIIKHYPDSFLKTTLQQELQTQEITDLVVCGMMSHMCVDTTVRSAKAKGYHITLIEDACTTKDLCRNGKVMAAKDVHDIYMASLDSGFARVMKADDYLEELQ